MTNEEVVISLTGDRVNEIKAVLETSLHCSVQFISGQDGPIKMAEDTILKMKILIRLALEMLPDVEAVREFMEKDNARMALKPQNQDEGRAMK